MGQIITKNYEILKDYRADEKQLFGGKKKQNASF